MPYTIFKSVTSHLTSDSFKGKQKYQKSKQTHYNKGRITACSRENMYEESPNKDLFGRNVCSF